MIQRTRWQLLAAVTVLAGAAHYSAGQSVPAPAARVPRESLVNLLRYASGELALEEAPASVTELVAIAQDQAVLKDREGLALTAAHVQAVLDLSNPTNLNWQGDEAGLGLAGAYGWAGQAEEAKAWAAKILAETHADDRAKMRAQMGDVTGAEAVIAAQKPADREIAYARLGASLWLGDRANAERMLKKAVDLGGKKPGVAAMGYARVGDYKAAAALADSDKNMFAWETIVEEMEKLQEFELAKSAKARFLVLSAADGAGTLSVTMDARFEFQMELETQEPALATAKWLVKDALRDIGENTLGWESQVTGAAMAAEAATRVGEDALARTMLDAAVKIKVIPERKQDADEQLAGYVATGKARRLLADGKWKEALEAAEGIASSTWKEDALGELVKDALRRGDVELAMKLYGGIEDAAVRQGDPVEWIGRALARRQSLGMPVAGKGVDPLAWAKSLAEHEERAKGARVVVEELLRRGAMKP